MADAVDSKSTEGNLVGVRVSPPAPDIKIRQYKMNRPYTAVQNL